MIRSYWLLGYLPLLLLIVVALHHRWRVRRIGQTSWKGGGFAMFTEIWRNEDLTQIWVEKAEGKEIPLLVVDQEQNFLRKKAGAIPTERNWLRWARWVAGQNWARCGPYAHQPHFLQDGGFGPVKKVTVRHRSLDFEGKTGTHRAQDRNIYTVDSKGRLL